MTGSLQNVLKMSAVLVNQLCNENTSVGPCVVKPGVPLVEVVKRIQKGLKKGDYIVCIAGTNDIGSDKVDGATVESIYNDFDPSS